MTQISDTEKKQQKKLILVWSITFLILFPFLATLGLLMRLNQGEVINLDMGTFYSIMTVHGLGMAGALYSIAYAALFYLLGSRYTKLNVQTGYFVYFLVLIGFIGLVIGTLIGKFGAGWYLLYPLPFKGTFWSSGWTAITSLSLIVLGVAWLIGALHILIRLAKTFGGFFRMSAMQYLGKKQPEEELPPIVMISTISLTAGVLAFLAGAVLLILFLMQYFEPALAFNPLLLKNLTFFFGHTLVNITMYCGVGWVYALLPEFTGREWKITRVTAWAWSATFWFILFAYLHHMYMDFAQPNAIQYFGQAASYFSAIPATAVTLFGVIAQIYRSKIRWTATPVLILIGAAGWAIGGFHALVDTTISFNKIYHNTLWVPAHFHTYMLMGVLLFIFAFLFYLMAGREDASTDYKPRLGIWLFILGGWGILSVFYFGGMSSVPRRYSSYGGISAGNVHEMGALLARIGAISAYVLLFGLLLMYITLIRGLRKKPQLG